MLKNTATGWLNLEFLLLKRIRKMHTYTHYQKGWKVLQLSYLSPALVLLRTLQESRKVHSRAICNLGLIEKSFFMSICGRLQTPFWVKGLVNLTAAFRLHIESKPIQSSMKNPCACHRINKRRF